LRPAPPARRGRHARRVYLSPRSRGGKHARVGGAAPCRTQGGGVVGGGRRGSGSKLPRSWEYATSGAIREGRETLPSRFPPHLPGLSPVPSRCSPLLLGSPLSPPILRPPLGQRYGPLLGGRRLHHASRYIIPHGVKGFGEKARKYLAFYGAEMGRKWAVSRGRAVMLKWSREGDARGENGETRCRDGMAGSPRVAHRRSGGLEGRCPAAAAAGAARSTPCARFLPPDVGSTPAGSVCPHAADGGSTLAWVVRPPAGRKAGGVVGGGRRGFGSKLPKQTSPALLEATGRAMGPQVRRGLAIGRGFDSRRLHRMGRGASVRLEPCPPRSADRH